MQKEDPIQQARSPGGSRLSEKTRLRRAVRISFSVLCCLLASLAASHGVWFKLGAMGYTAATRTLLQNNVSAGIPGFANGNLMVVQGQFPVSGSGANSGPGGYITFYVPSGTEVVGAQIVDTAGNPLPARPATSAQSGEGISKGWGPIGTLSFATGVNAWNPAPLAAACTTYGKTAATCMSGLAYVYGDTGLFYSTRSDTALYTGDGSGVISLINGYGVNPTSALPWPDIGGTGQARIHNRWDAVQSNAFGAGAGPVTTNPGFSVADNTAINTTGRGSTPYLAGSPVAGPTSGLPLDRAASTGPWNRLAYSGGCLAGAPAAAPATSAGGIGADPVTAINSLSVCSATLSGGSLTLSSPLPAATNAVRFAVGGITWLPVTETFRVQVTLRVTNAAALTPINFEASGGDSTQGVKAGNDNPWRYWVGAIATPSDPASLAIRKEIVAVNGVAVTPSPVSVPAGARLRYRVTYANTWIRPQTNVLLKDLLPTKVTAVSNFTVVSGPNLLPIAPAAPTGGSTFAFTGVTLGAGQGGVVEFDADTSTVAGDTLVNTASVQSTQVTAPVSSAVSVSVVGSADLSISKAGPPYARPGDSLSYTVSLHNNGPDTATGITVTDTLPAYLTYTGSTPAATVSGQVLTWNLASLPSGGTQNYIVTANAPSAVVLTSTPAARSQSNTVHVASTTSDQFPANDDASAATIMIYPVLGKRVRNVSQNSPFGTAGTGRPGELLEYCLDFSNLGGSNLANFILSDTVPTNTDADLSGYGAGLGLQVTRGSVTTRTSTSGDTDGGSLSAAALSLDLGTLAAGESGSVCFRAGIK